MRFFANIDKGLTLGITVIFTLIISNLYRILTAFGFAETVPKHFLTIAVILMWVVFLVTYSICANKKKSELPKVRCIALSKTKDVRFIVNKNDLFSFESLVSIYYYDINSEIEILLGVGYVENITIKGFFQIVMLKWIDSDEANEICERINRNENIANSMIMKPSIPKIILGGITNGNI